MLTELLRRTQRQLYQLGGQEEQPEYPRGTVRISPNRLPKVSVEEGTMSLDDDEDDFVEVDGQRYPVLPMSTAEAELLNQSIMNDDFVEPEQVESIRQTKTSGDFLNEARRLVDQGSARTMTEAMKKVRRRWPELHEAFKTRCALVGPEIYNEL